MTNNTTTTAPASECQEAIDEELAQIAGLLPARYREVFCFRWGLNGQFTHITSQAATRFELPRGTVEDMLARCTWNLARHAHHCELPAIKSLLGDDRTRWAERAWQHTEGIWGNQDSQFSQTVLLLALGGLDVPAAHQAARQHMIRLGLGRSNRWGTPTTREERTEAARNAVDRIIDQAIWPAADGPRDLGALSVQRPLPSWAPAKTGAFQSTKLARFVEFESELELVMLRQLDLDPRIVNYIEQPLTIPYVLDGETHPYTPDVVAQLDDGRVLVLELKPLERLGEFRGWMKWASLARYCAQHGFGFWIGSPQRSLTDHARLQPDPDLHDLIASDVKHGAIEGDDYRALARLVSYEQLGLAATQQQLEWRTDTGYIRPLSDGDRREIANFWSLVQSH